MNYPASISGSGLVETVEPHLAAFAEEIGCAVALPSDLPSVARAGVRAAAAHLHAVVRAVDGDLATHFPTRDGWKDAHALHLLQAARGGAEEEARAAARQERRRRALLAQFQLRAPTATRRAARELARQHTKYAEDWLQRWSDLDLLEGAAQGADEVLRSISALVTFIAQVDADSAEAGHELEYPVSVGTWSASWGGERVKRHARWAVAWLTAALAVIRGESRADQLAQTAGSIARAVDDTRWLSRSCELAPPAAQMAELASEDLSLAPPDAASGPALARRVVKVAA